MQQPGFLPVMPFHPIFSQPIVHPPPIVNNLTPLVPAISPHSLPFFPPPQIPHFSQSYGMASLSSLTIIKPEHFLKTVTLPPELRENYKPTKFEYNFSAELETISQIAEEKRREEKMREIELKQRKERELKAQQEAWTAIQAKRNRVSTTPPRSFAKDPNTLVDLNFEDEMKPAPPPKVRTNSFSITETQRKPIFKDQKSETLYRRFIEMELQKEAVQTAIELLGADDEIKLLNFVTYYQKLDSLPQKFGKVRIQQALIMYDCDYTKALDFLNQCNQLLKIGISEKQIIEALSMYSNDIKQASQFLLSYKSLSEFGFSDLKIREALVMCGNDSQKSIQYLLENSS